MIESRLACWKPRRPSPNLSGRLFGGRAVSAPAGGIAPAAQSFVHWAGWRWLAPALGCLTLALLALGPRPERLAALDGATNNFLTEVTTHPMYAAYLAAGFHCEQNGPAAGALCRPYAGRAPVAVRPAAAVLTNRLPAH